MSWTTFRTQLKTLVESVSNMGEVSVFPKLTFDSYPGAYIIPSDSESDYETTSENERVYSFLVRLFYETKDTTVAQALTNLEQAVDNVIDVIDEEDKLRSGRTIGLSMPAKYTFLAIRATPSSWGEIPSEHLIMAELRVSIHVSYDAT